MNDLDEKLAEVYRDTNIEVMDLLVKSQKMLHNTNLILAVLCIMLSVSVMLVSCFCYYNNQRWLELWNEYEYEIVVYSQDGEGQNNINMGTMGDVTNGAEVDH